MLDTLLRAYRGLTRSLGRTALVVVLLGAVISFALTAVTLAFAAGDELDKIKLTTGVEASVTVNPQQFQRAIQEEIARAQEAGEEFTPGQVDVQVEPLTEEHAEALASLPYVRSVDVFSATGVQYDLPGEDSDEEEEQEEDTARQPAGPGGAGIGGFTIPDASLTGTKDSAYLSDFRSSTKILTDGRLYDPDDAGSNVIVIDQNTATLEGLSVGDTFTVKTEIPAEDDADDAETEYRTVDVEIIGVYEDLETASEGGFRGFGGFSIEEWYAPIDLVRQLQDPEESGSVSSISIVYDSVDRADQFVEDAGQILDPDLYSLTTSQDRFEEIAAPLETMQNTSVVVTVAGLGVAALIMVMLMALVMRGRVREIGILKAIGARNRQVAGQFMLETVGVAVVAVALAVPALFAVNSFLPELLRPSAEASVQEQQTGRPFRGGGPGGGGPRGILVNAGVTNDPVRTEEIESALSEIDASVSMETIAVAAAMAIGLGLVGAAVPLIVVLRLRPAEVLRMEG
ncbi:MAG: ABC transporter permease [Dehalococcoidia bacterium]